MEIGNSQYRDLVLDIYQAVTDPGHWVRIMDRISDLVSARGGMILELRNIGGQLSLETPLMSSSYDPALVAAYFERHRDAETRDHLVFDKRLLEADGIDILSEDILFDDKERYLNQPHVRELAERGIAHRTGALLDKDNPFRARFSLSMGRERGLFSAEEKAMLKDLLPHLAKALELSRNMGSPGTLRPALLSILESLSIGVCLVDSQGRAAEMNSEFHRQKNDYKSFSVDTSGRLRFANPGAEARAKELFDDALNHAQSGARPRKEAILLETPVPEAALCVEVVPLEKSDFIGSQAFNGALLISRDTSIPVEFDLSLTKRVFALTEAETSVLGLVSSGLTNGEIAERRERSVETVNAQMKSILDKTRTLNRTQLVRLLCNFAEPFSSPKL